jgi:predicted DNA binding CopG/RHH family protein
MKHNETRGRKPLSLSHKMVTVTLRILPAEIEAIKVHASAEGIGEGEWKRRAIRAALHHAAKPSP